MKKLYYWSLMLGLVFGSLTFTACGDDDDDDAPGTTGTTETAETPDTPANPTSIVGKWVGEWPALDEDKRVSQMDDLMWRYAHKLFYTISSDKTFEIVESACWYSTESSRKEYDQPSLSIDPARPNGAYLVERISHRLRGHNYTLTDNKIVLFVDHEAWSGTDEFADEGVEYEITFDYTISGNKLIINKGELYPVSPHNLIAFGEMTYQGQ